MPTVFTNVLAVVGRLMLVTIFLMSALGNKIPNFSGIVGYMEAKGVPMASVALVGAIAFLLVGSVSVLLGWYARIGATLLLVFLVLATYYFHNFWAVPAEAVQNEMIQAMKNLAIMGAMVGIIANGPGAMSIDAREGRESEKITK